MKKAKELNCREATLLILKTEEKELEKTEQESLEQHLQACSLCRHFETQNQLINNLLHQHDPFKSGLGEDEKKAIIQNIERQLP